MLARALSQWRVNREIIFLATTNAKRNATRRRSAHIILSIVQSIVYSYIVLQRAVKSSLIVVHSEYVGVHNRCGQVKVSESYRTLE